MVFQKADGTVFRAATQIVAVPDNDGSPSATFLIIRPAPEPTQDRALEGGASRAIEDALDVITEGVAVYDRDDRLVLCNTAFRRSGSIRACTRTIISRRTQPIASTTRRVA